MINQVVKFVGINAKGSVLAIGNDGYAYQRDGIQNAHFSNTEEDAKKEIRSWINSYPHMFEGFVVVPVTISYDLDHPIV